MNPNPTQFNFGGWPKLTTSEREETARRREQAIVEQAKDAALLRSKGRALTDTFMKKNGGDYFDIARTSEDDGDEDVEHTLSIARALRELESSY